MEAGENMVVLDQNETRNRGQESPSTVKLCDFEISLTLLRLASFNMRMGDSITFSASFRGCCEKLYV